MSLVPPNYQIDYNTILNSTIHLQDQKYFDYVLSLVPQQYQLDWDKIISSAKLFGNDLLDYILTLAPQNKY